MSEGPDTPKSLVVWGVVFLIVLIGLGWAASSLEESVLAQPGDPMYEDYRSRMISIFQASETCIEEEVIEDRFSNEALSHSVLLDLRDQGAVGYVPGLYSPDKYCYRGGE